MKNFVKLTVKYYSYKVTEYNQKNLQRKEIFRFDMDVTSM
jgi:hypothetical protein